MLRVYRKKEMVLSLYQSSQLHHSLEANKLIKEFHFAEVGNSLFPIS